MIEEIQSSLKMEVRFNSQAFEYLEAVIEKEDLELLESLLMKHLGRAAKVTGEEVNLPMEAQRFVDSMGGLRVDQSFYYRQGRNNDIAFALLWPWASNPKKITLKVGSGSIIEFASSKVCLPVKWWA